MCPHASAFTDFYNDKSTYAHWFFVTCQTTHAGALGEARTRSGMRSRKRGQEAANVMQELADELTHIAEGPAGPAIRCATLEALFWFQVLSSNHRAEDQA